MFIFPFLFNFNRFNFLKYRFIISFIILCTQKTLYHFGIHAVVISRNRRSSRSIRIKPYSQTFVPILTPDHLATSIFDSRICSSNRSCLNMILSLLMCTDIAKCSYFFTFDWTLPFLLDLLRKFMANIIYLISVSVFLVYNVKMWTTCSVTWYKDGKMHFTLIPNWFHVTGNIILFNLDHVAKTCKCQASAPTGLLSKKKERTCNSWKAYFFFLFSFTLLLC